MKQTGVTLLELILVLAIAAILLTFAVPGFSALARSGAISGAANEWLASLHLARSEAIKRSGRVVLCISADGDACAATGGWHQGWIVFHDRDANGARDADEPLVLKREALAPGLRLTGNTHVARYIAYTPSGGCKLVSGAIQAGTLTLCHQDDPPASRQVVINFTGRPRTAKTALSACP
jgi:type IV fimbrial biogenesis protein FimT